MANAKSRLRPYHVFKYEVTRVNQLYWVTGYSYDRTRAILRAIAETGDTAVPRVDHLWPSVNKGQARQTTVPLPEFIGNFDQNLESLRLSSVLYLCSAFENALSGYFVLCCLYRPKQLDASWTHAACPALTATPTEFSTLVRRSADAAGASLSKSKLRGPYSERLKKMESMFGLGLPLSSLPASALDAHYKVRHQIAHDQGLTAADDPTLSIDEVLAGSANVSEAVWKAMNAEFLKTVEEVDSAVRKSVVGDHGACLAVMRVLTRSPSSGSGLSVGQLRDMASKEWKVEFSYADVVSALASLGRSTSTEKAVFRRVIR